MKRALIFLAVTWPWCAFSQALQDINYSYLYDPGSPFSFDMRIAKMADEWHVFYGLTVRSGEKSPQSYSIEWATRANLDDEKGHVLSIDSSRQSNQVHEKTLYGRLTLPAGDEMDILSAKILDVEAKKVWFFYEVLRPNYPVNGYFSDKDGRPLLKTYYATEQPIRIHTSQERPVGVSYYDHNFPAAAPSFSEAQAKVSTGLRVDTTFSMANDEESSLIRPGLFLVQQDTSTTKGFSFRLYTDYPRYQYLENLVDPLIYVCTRQEFERLKKADTDKKAFDRVILGITGDTERARNFMREYFRRVEWANINFHSYKEGWKTDRGMTFIIFGVPNEVFRFRDREVWNYTNQYFTVSFDFVRSSTLFDPDNFVLIRNKKYQDTWYTVVDLWRSARF